MKSALRGISLPISFSSTKLTPRKKRIDPNTNEESWVSGKSVAGYFELFFSSMPIKIPEEVDLLEPGHGWAKAMRLYIEYNFYGEHEYLIPVTHQKIEPPETRYPGRFAFPTIGTDPATATYRESLQLIPCAKHNLELFKDKLQTEPFFIEIQKKYLPDVKNKSPQKLQSRTTQIERCFTLYIKDHDDRYRKIPCLRYSPTCWHGFAHPVVTLHHQASYLPVHDFKDIPWRDLATHIGR